MRWLARALCARRPLGAHPWYRLTSSRTTTDKLHIHCVRAQDFFAEQGRARMMVGILGGEERTRRYARPALPHASPGLKSHSMHAPP